MMILITTLLFISLTSIAYADNEIYIEQVGTADDLTITINQDGDDNSVNLSIAHDDNTLDVNQVGNNNTVSWVSYWGSGQSWGGDIDGSNNDLKLEQYNTTGSDSNRIGFHIPGDKNKNCIASAWNSSRMKRFCSSLKCISASIWGAQGGSTNHVVQPFCCPGLPWGQNGPKTSPESLRDPPNLTR